MHAHTHIHICVIYLPNSILLMDFSTVDGSQLFSGVLLTNKMKYS